VIELDFGRFQLRSVVGGGEGTSAGADELISVAAYLRASSKDQKDSIPLQKAALESLARRHGYKIIKWYIDYGKSGAKDQEKREEFHRLLRDCAKHEFRALICYDQSRFSRLDSIKGAADLQILRENNILLHTLLEGVIDLNSDSGRLITCLKCESNNKYSLDISFRSITGRIGRLNAGIWPHGAVPYGFDKLYTCGRDQILKPRLERFRKPKGWIRRLVENNVEVAIIREVCSNFDLQEISQYRLADELNARGVPSPSGVVGGWTPRAIKDILTNPAYIGIGHVGKRRARKKQALFRFAAAEHQGCCPAIIDKFLFERIQEKLKHRKRINLKPQNRRGSVLSSFLFCGHCGYRLDKKCRKGERYFTCPSATRRSRFGCHQWRVYEAEILPHIKAFVRENIGQAELMARRSMPQQPEAPELKLLLKAREVLMSDVSSAEDSFLRGPRQFGSSWEKIAPGLVEKLAAMREELHVVEEKVRQIHLTQHDPGEEIQRFLRRFPEALVALDDSAVWNGAFSERVPVHLPDNVTTIIRERYGTGFLRKRFWWSFSDGVQFDPEGPVYDIEPDDTVFVWEINLGTGTLPTVYEPAVLRQLFRDIGLKVKLFWEPNGPRYFRLSVARMQVELSENFMRVPDSRCSRARSRGTD